MFVINNASTEMLTTELMKPSRKIINQQRYQPRVVKNNSEQLARLKEMTCFKCRFSSRNSCNFTKKFPQLIGITVPVHRNISQLIETTVTCT